MRKWGNEHGHLPRLLCPRATSAWPLAPSLVSRDPVSVLGAGACVKAKHLSRDTHRHVDETLTWVSSQAAAAKVCFQQDSHKPKPKAAEYPSSPWAGRGRSSLGAHTQHSSSSQAHTYSQPLCSPSTHAWIPGLLTQFTGHLHAE